MYISWALTNTWVLQALFKIKNIPQKAPHALSQLFSSFFPHPVQPRCWFFFHHRLVSSIPELYRNVLFSLGPFAQYIGFEIHPSIVCYFLRPNSISLCDYTAHLPNNGCLGCFQFLALKIKLLWISHTSLFVDTYLNFSWV